ncbi:MAG: nickel pincer cofactor biosynthesis protein LarC [Actinomycetota bacterium]|nr:nickel pincer cofactor biosynthesis protein LarC [Actinomycetota bacterium]
MGSLLHIDCFAGISGDMMVAALLDLGLELEAVREELSKLPLSGYEISLKDTRPQSLAAKKFEVKVSSQESRNYQQIKDMLKSARLNPQVKKDSLGMFKILAEAEAKIHGCSPEEVHFHEVGAVDSIIDIVAAAAAMNKLKIGQVSSSHIPLGSGLVKCDHGLIPVPAPAVTEILKGAPVYGGPFDFEVTTPTGATILKHYVQQYGSLPPAVIEAVGMGAGSRQQGHIPNVLRLIKLKQETSQDSGQVKLLSANIDDMSPEIIAYVCHKLGEKGALDVWIENIFMKKARPAYKLCLLVPAGLEPQLVSTIFSETTTLGIRSIPVGRHVLQRKIEEVKLSYGTAHIKIGYNEGKIVTAEPEYESCLQLAQRTGRALKEVYADVKNSFISGVN